MQKGLGWREKGENRLFSHTNPLWPRFMVSIEDSDFVADKIYRCSSRILYISNKKREKAVASRMNL